MHIACGAQLGEIFADLGQISDGKCSYRMSMVCVCRHVCLLARSLQYNNLYTLYPDCVWYCNQANAEVRRLTAEVRYLQNILASVQNTGISRQEHYHVVRKLRFLDSYYDAIGQRGV